MIVPITQRPGAAQSPQVQMPLTPPDPKFALMAMAAVHQDGRLIKKTPANMTQIQQGKVDGQSNGG